MVQRIHLSVSDKCMSLWTVGSKVIGPVGFSPQRKFHRNKSRFFLNTFKFRMWRSIPASFWLSMKTQVAFQGCLFGTGVSDMRARLLHETDIGCTKKVTLFCPKGCVWSSGQLQKQPYKTFKRSNC